MSSKQRSTESVSSRVVPARRSQRRRTTGRRPPRGRARRSRRLLLAAVGAVATAALVLGVIVATRGPSHPLGGPAGPEGVKLETGALLAAAGAVDPAQGAQVGVGCGATEQLATHVHTHLAVFADGAFRPIPAGVGMVGQLQTQASPEGDFVAGSSDCLYWLHTHAQDGIIHVEAPAGRTFYLGQFFAIWGQPLSQHQVGAATGPVTAYVNGHLWTDGIEAIPLLGHETVQLDVGAPLIGPKSVGFANL